MNKSIHKILSLIIIFSLAAALPMLGARATANITQWNFNSLTPDANPSTGVTTPAIGAGTAALAGSVSASFSTADVNGGSMDPVTGDDSGWGITTFAAQGTGDETRGVQFNVSTVGQEDIIVTWDERHSNTSSRYVRFQYSTDGFNFTNLEPLYDSNAGDTWFNRTADLSSIPAVDDNPNFAFRIVAAFAPSTSAYAPSNTSSSYATNGTWRFDMVTVGGSPIPALTSTPTETATPSPTATATGTATPTQAEDATATATESATDTMTPTPTEDAALTATPSPTGTLTGTNTPTQTEHATATATASATGTMTPTPTEDAALTATPSPTGTNTPTQTEATTLTPTPTATTTQTPTLPGTATPTRTLTPTSAPTTTTTPTATPVTLKLNSVAIQDGWVLESSETSGGGGSVNNTATVFRLGDDHANRQYRAILSFNTAAIPDGAAIQSATLRIRQNGTPIGSNPFNILGNLLVQIRTGSFANNVALRLNDFNAPATSASLGSIINTPVSNWYTKILNTAGRNAINKTGVTQFRLYFARGDNNDLSNDYLRFHTGNSASNQPELTIVYTMP